MQVHNEIHASSAHKLAVYTSSYISPVARNVYLELEFKAYLHGDPYKGSAASAVHGNIWCIFA